jgi:hypothetical protein
MSMAAAQAYFEVDHALIKKCRGCSEEIFLHQSRRNGQWYSTSVLTRQDGAGNTIKVTSRTNFHHCDPVAKARYQTQQQAKQQNLFQPKLNVAGIQALFDKAMLHLKNPKIWLQTKSGKPVRLHRAGAMSRYKGQLMVTDGEDFGQNIFYGRIDQAGVFDERDESTQEVREVLQELSNDPAGTASKYGKLTGNCCFCHRKLEDERSTAVGYGPICADHYQLPWG